MSYGKMDCVVVCLISYGLVYSLKLGIMAIK